MNAPRRAWLHVSRKKGKTALLLAILTLIIVLLSSSVLIFFSMQNTLETLKKELRSSFCLETDYNNSALWTQTMEFKGQVLNCDIVEKVAQFEGISQYNTEKVYNSTVFALDFELVPGFYSFLLEQELYIPEPKPLLKKEWRSIRCCAVLPYLNYC
ncbi:MAG: hypothetical protein ACOX88_02010 [Christensenellales bacterium]|jgi:hypothetical protein